MSLQADAFACHDCDANRFGFERAPGRDAFLKFPATIGAAAQASLLFVGINPYRDQRNRRLYPDAMRSPQAFATLAANREPKPGLNHPPRYIRRYNTGPPPSYGAEPYYRQYMDIIEGIWGTGATFDAHAAATELYLCSTASSAGGAFTEDSHCARKFFPRTYAQVQPVAVITVGRPPRLYLRELGSPGGVAPTMSPYRMSLGGHSAWVFHIPHNNARATGDTRARALDHAIIGIKNLIHDGRAPQQMPFAQLLAATSTSAGAGPPVFPVSAEILADARQQLAAGRPFTDGRVYEIYNPARPAYRPQYRAYLAAWDIRQALGVDKADVRIATETTSGGYRFRIVPKRPLRGLGDQA